MKIKSKPRTTPILEEETPAKVTIDELLSKIDFSTDNVVAAAAENPKLFVAAIDYRLQCMRRRSTAKMIMEQAQAGADLNIRKQARQSGGKVTERYIEELVLLDADVAALVTEFSKADELDEYSKLVVEAFRMRRDCLRIVGDLTRDEISMARAVESGAERLEDTRQRLRARFPGV